MLISIILNALNAIFGSGLNDEVTNWMSQMLSAMENLFTNGGIMDTGMTLFAGICASLLVIYFMMDVINMAKRDLLTLEKFVIECIKFIAAFALVICLKDLMLGIVSLGKNLYDWMNSDEVVFNVSNSSNVILFDGEVIGTGVNTAGPWPPNMQIADGDPVYEAFQNRYSGLGNALDCVAMMISCIIPALVNAIASFVAYFLVTSNCLNIIIRAIFAPIGVAQLFEDGTRSSGIRYIKRFVSLCITFAVMCVIMKIASGFSSLIFNVIITKNAIAGTPLTFSLLEGFMSFGNSLLLSLPLLAGVGAMIGAGRVADDLMGVH